MKKNKAHAKMGRPTKFIDAETETLTFRVPVTFKEEIKQKVYKMLEMYT